MLNVTSTQLKKPLNQATPPGGFAHLPRPVILWTWTDFLFYFFSLGMSTNFACFGFPRFRLPPLPGVIGFFSFLQVEVIGIKETGRPCLT